MASYQLFIGSTDRVPISLDFKHGALRVDVDDCLLIDIVDLEPVKIF